MRKRLFVILPLALCVACGGSGDHATPRDAAGGETTTADGDGGSDANGDSTDNTDTVDPNDPRSVLSELPEREEARELGLSIIQSYFDNDPQVFIDLIGDVLPQVGREGETMDGEYFRELVGYVTPYPSGEDFTMYTMEQYHEVFDPLVVTYDEAVEHFEFPAVSNDGWIPEEGDFLYLGGYLRPGREEADKFIRDGLNSFVFGKRDGIWKFVGFVS